MLIISLHIYIYIIYIYKYDRLVHIYIYAYIYTSMSQINDRLHPSTNFERLFHHSHLSQQGTLRGSRQKGFRVSVEDFTVEPKTATKTYVFVYAGVCWLTKTTKAKNNMYTVIIRRLEHIWIPYFKKVGHSWSLNLCYLLTFNFHTRYPSLE